MKRSAPVVSRAQTPPATASAPKYRLKVTLPARFPQDAGTSGGQFSRRVLILWKVSGPADATAIGLMVDAAGLDGLEALFPIWKAIQI
jgi:hypothetical protein